MTSQRIEVITFSACVLQNFADFVLKFSRRLLRTVDDASVNRGILTWFPDRLPFISFPSPVLGLECPTLG